MTTDPRDNLARKVFLAETAAVREYLAEQEQASTDKAAAIASCPGYETSPTPCRCPCRGAATHTNDQTAQACNSCGTPAHPYLNCDQAQQARKARP